MNLQGLHQSLVKSAIFKKWRAAHQEGDLSHFFSSVSTQLQQKTAWEIGYFNPSPQKITVFLPAERSFMIKQEDDVFKAETSTVERLELEAVATDFEQAAKACQQNLASLFPQDSLGDGFVVLQNFLGKTQWNFTFVTKSLKFANVKVNAASGEIDSHQLVEAVRREK